MIRLDDVSVTLGNAPVLDDVSLTVEEGTVVGLIGPNGTGKTTLLRTINGVLTPDSGTVTVDGRDVHALSARDVGRTIATVPQDTSVPFEFTVETLVEMGRTPYYDRLGRSEGDHATVVDRALERTGTAGLRDRQVSAVSGGERQRVLLAQALAQETPVLLLDEPTASLDVNHQIATLDLVTDLVVTDGKTVLTAIHDLDLAARYCDRLALLSDGAIAAAGDPETVLRDDHLGDAFRTRTAVTTNPVTGTPTVTALTDSAERSLHVHVVGDGKVAARTIASLVDAGVAVSAGVVRADGFAAETASERDVETVTAPPFEPVPDAAHASASSLSESAHVTVLADPVVAADGAQLDIAAANETLVVVETTDFADRNYDGATTRDAYESLRSRARVVDAPDDAIRAVIDATTEREATAEE